MASPPNEAPVQPCTFVGLLRDHEEDLIQRWIRRVLEDPEVPEANRLSEPLLRDDMPRFIEQLIQASTRRERGEGSGEALGREVGRMASAEYHAHSRAMLQYTLQHALREMSHLRASIIDMCRAERVVFEGEDASLVNAAIDEAMATVATNMEQAARSDRELERKLLRSVLHILPVGVFIADAKGRLLETNPAATAIWGASRPLVDHPSKYGEYQAFWPDTGRRIASEEWGLARALAHGEISRDEELDIVTFDGQRRTILNSAMPLLDEAGTIVGAISVNVDITERLQAARELRKEAALRERFIGILGHDLRNPLSAIRFAAEVLQRREDMPDKALRSLGRIVSSADRMGRLIDDMLELARSRSGGSMPISRKPTDLRVICRQLVEELEAIHPDRSIEYTEEGDVQGVWDADRLAQVVSNLLGNALSYSPEGTSVRLRLLGEGDWVRLEVHNHGLPISADLLPKLFDPFRRGAATVGQPGSASGLGLGLGLFIAREIVYAHGGSIEVKSDAEEGTSFAVSLPRKSSP